ncbi:MAG: hypothetical protein VB032_08350 [Burkholderiaceae bacterium]|nr:hypothetical protein [Burkholderiaceae bacterium]
MATQINFPPALIELANGRDHVKTEEFAKSFSVAPQTVRKNYCQQGECYGIRPIKVGRNLLWPVAEIASVLTEGRM